MRQPLLSTLLVLLVGCTSEPAKEVVDSGVERGADYNEDDGTSTDDSETSDGPTGDGSCAPQMSVFPVDGPHNIGYDEASCGDACALSCPDVNANSDWGPGASSIDIYADHRTPLVAVADGLIVASTDTSLSLLDDCAWEYHYGDMDETVVWAGLWVTAGELLGYVGDVGSPSPRVSFGVSPDGAPDDVMDPFALLDETSPTACSGATDPGDGTIDDETDTTPDIPDTTDTTEPTEEPCGGLGSGTSLSAGDSVSSCDGRFLLAMQSDGNLVLYMGSTALWSTYTNGYSGAYAAMQSDGNLVLYQSGTAIWNTYTYNHPGATLAVQNDGNLVIYDSGTAIWDSGTCCY